MKQGWEIKKLGEVCEIERGGSPRPIQAYITEAEDGINWIKIGDAIEGSKYIISTKEKIKPEGMKKSRFVHKGDFILSNSMSFGRPYILAVDGCIHDGWLVIRDKGNRFDKSYLYYYLGSPNTYNEFKRLAVGGVVNNLNSELVRSVTIPIPPLAEQEKIVAELDCLSGVIEKKKQQLKELDLLAQSIFYTMFGDPISNEKGWEVKKLGEVCEDKKKIFRASKKCALDDVINYIDISAIDNINNVINIPTPYIFEEAPSRAQQVVQLGDVIVSMVRPNLKNIAIVNCNYDNLIASSGFCVLRARKEMTIPFLFYIVKSDAFTMYLMDRVSGANYPAVRESDITDYISIIPPITLQQEFADKIEAIEKQKALIKESIKEVEELFNSRMDYYFG